MRPIYPALAFFPLFSTSISASTITWGTPNNVSSTSDISTNGTLIEAYNLGGSSSAEDVTINSVLFTGKSDLLTQNSNNSFYTGDTGDSLYNQLLASIDYGNGTNLVTLTLADGLLEAGDLYEIQVWYADSRYSDRITPVGDLTGNTVDLLSSPGQYASGTFTATDSSLILTLESPGFGNAHLNAYQIRKIGDGVEPDPELNASLYGPLKTASPEFKIYITFSEAISGLTVDDFNIENGTVSNITGSGRYYSLTITAEAKNTVEVFLKAEAVSGMSSGLLNTISNTLVTECTADFGEIWRIDDANDWNDASENSSNLDISGGFATPTAASALFSSELKTFSSTRKASKLVFTQSNEWKNWTKQDLHPGGSDAPVFVPAGAGDYYYLALSSGSYHAWHSTNMIDWTHKGPVTTGSEGRWVTSAEYKDGQFYIYSDYANDHISHVFVDDDLGDGIPGLLHRNALNRINPAARTGSGSDLSAFRDNADGLFHLIYEDWSPIDARSHSWDSPLAGHVSSTDGINGFSEGEHDWAVDHRTTPTGTFDSYTHPFIDYDPIYEIHEGGQDAYGDWTSIKVGNRYYLFGDFHPHGENIKLAIFSSNSIYEPYDLVGSLDSGGHPDPTVGFAEGQFYLITQRDDFYSPGPWIDGVDARAGVDVDGDGSIDQWTAWASVTEKYDYTPGYIRVVTTNPAHLDLSELPAGYGFKFEFRTDDNVVPGIQPVMDVVEMYFEPSNFQKWSNSMGISAVPQGDANANSIPDLIDFSLGQLFLPQRQTDGLLSVPMTADAIEDGLTLEMWYSVDLDNWFEATGATEGVTYEGMFIGASGNTNFNYRIFPPNGENTVFWKWGVNPTY